MPNLLNFTFCNAVFLKLFYEQPSIMYNHFYNKENTKAAIDSMGDHPEINNIEFRYDSKNKIRGTFISFNNATSDLDVTCICILFQSGRFNKKVFFFERYEDGSIGCVDVGINSRIVRELNVGTTIDNYFELVCKCIDIKKDDSKLMLFYKEADKNVFLLDMLAEELNDRFIALTHGSKYSISCKIIDGIKFLFYNSQIDSSCLIARTQDGINPIDLDISDVDILKNHFGI